MSRSDTTSPQSSKAATSTLAHPSHCTFTFPFRIPTAFIRLLFSSAIIRYSFQGISPYILPSFDLWSFARRLTNVDDTYESTSDTMVSAFKTCQAEGCGATWITFDDGVECPVCGFSEGVPPPQHPLWPVIADMIRAGYVRFTVRGVLKFKSFELRKKRIVLIKPGCFTAQFVISEMVELMKDKYLVDDGTMRRGCKVYRVPSSIRFLELMP